ncbi:MAG: hypothetical protein ACJ735_12435 [Actinomycetes bacterium]
MDLSASDDVTDLSVNSGERRRYNRRRPESQPSPPYFAVFERMAESLEAIVSLLDIGISEARERQAEQLPRVERPNLPSQSGPGR